jgi:hypothetical protein
MKDKYTVQELRGMGFETAGRSVLVGAGAARFAVAIKPDGVLSVASLPEGRKQQFVAALEAKVPPTPPVRRARRKRVVEAE